MQSGSDVNNHTDVVDTGYTVVADTADVASVAGVVADTDNTDDVVVAAGVVAGDGKLA